ANGESLPSAEISGTVSAADQTLNVSWVPLAGATGYKVYRGSAPGQENTLIAVTDQYTTSINDVGAPGVPASNTAGLAAPTNVKVVDVVGGKLSPFTQYFYEVTALDATGESLASSEVSGTTTFQALTLVVSWTAVNGATGYRVYRSTVSGQETLLATIGGAITQFLDAGSAPPPVIDGSEIGSPTLNPIVQTTTNGAGLPPQFNGAYYYAVTAIDAQGESLPSNVQVQNTTNVFNALQLSWTPVPGATGYKVYRGTDSFFQDTLVAVVGAGTTTFTDVGGPTFEIPPSLPGAVSATNTTGMPAPIQALVGVPATAGNLLPNTTYYYEITAFNSGGETLPSNE
ncbi:MAG: hypothetical protein ACREHD_32110, partial [Pirellulales bacterium]